jgi:hypothetical protein
MTKKNERNQVGSGRIMAVTHDSTFFNPNDSADLGNSQDKQFFDREAKILMNSSGGYQ